MPAAFDPLAIATLIALGALLAAIGVLALRVRALARLLAGSGGDPRVLDRLAVVEREICAATRRLEHLSGRADRLDEQAAKYLQRVGLVRYDAFRELGGHLSFSVALLDARRHGLVLSVLNDRDGARAYAKPVADGRSTFVLSEEEQRAISEA
jgi:hypothetical protein